MPYFQTQNLTIGHVYLIGPSEGGLLTALGVERYPEVFSGGLALCGPVGDMQKQINYWGDFRVLFDYFFPTVLPPSAMNVPDQLINNWDPGYRQAVQLAISKNPSALNQLLKVARAPYDLLDPATKKATVDAIVWYNVFATNDGIAKFGGIPFDNHNKFYTGSRNDLRLNRKVARYTESRDVKAAVQAFNTSGNLDRPLVTMHTTGDPVVPYWHETLYNAKIFKTGSTAMHVNIPVVRYGHCAFQSSEAMAGFAVMVYKVTGQLPAGLLQALPTAQQTTYQKLVQKAGVK